MSTELAATASPTDEDRLFQAEALVRSYCGWHIAPEREDTLTVAGWELSRVFLPSLRVTEVSVTRNMVALFADSDYYFDQPRGTVLFPYYYGPDEFVITYTHGFEVPPEDVTAVVQSIAARATDNPRGVVSKTVGPFSESYGQTTATGTAVALSDAEKAVLGPYRIQKVT